MPGERLGLIELGMSADHQEQDCRPPIPIFENRPDIAAHIDAPATGIPSGQGVGVKSGMPRIGQKSSSRCPNCRLILGDRRA